ncbi:MAG TPA: hypothetical protein VGB26_06855 [Nitrospiria bacterium]
MFKVYTGQGSSQSHSVVEAFEVLEVPAKSSSSFPNGFIWPACRQAGIQDSKNQHLLDSRSPIKSFEDRLRGNDGKGLDFRFPLPASARRTGG